LANLIANILVVAGGIAVIVFAWLAQLPTYQLILLTVGTIGLVLWVINQIAIWRERHKKKLSKFSDKEIENTIREWIDIPGYTFKRSDMGIDGAYFVFTLTDTEGRPINITRNVKDPHYIQIWSDLLLFPDIPDITEGQKTPREELKKIKQLIQDNIDKIGFSLSLEILRLGCHYQFFKEQGILRLVTDVYLEDSLDSSDFIRQCLFVTRAMTLVRLIFTATFGGIMLNELTSDKEKPQP